MACEMIEEHEINKQENMFIGGYYCSDELIDPLVKYLKTLPLKGGSSSNNGELERWDGKTNNHHKQCYECDILWPALDVSAIHNYLEWQQSALDIHVNKYLTLKEGSPFKLDPSYNFQVYPKGMAYQGWHCERSSFGTSLRMMSWMVYLNDCKDGGETTFLYQKYKMKPEKGLLLFWPSDYTHTHKGLPSFKSEKMIMTGWYSYIRSDGGSLGWI